MKINPVNNNQNFEGKVIVKNAINPQQNHLFKLHKPALDNMIKDLPFDLFVEQSKSKKTISLTADVENAYSYIVRKNEQDYERVAGYAISDGMQKSELYKKMVKANELLNLLKMEWINVLSGKYKEAKEAHKEMAKYAVKNFDIYKSITPIHIINLPPEAFKIFVINPMKYHIYNLFQPKSAEEKQLYKMNKEYIKEMKSQNKEIKPVQIDFSKMYY